MNHDPLSGDSSPWVTVRCPYCSTPQRILKAYLPSNVSRAHVARRCEGCGKAWQAVIECTWLRHDRPELGIAAHMPTRLAPASSTSDAAASEEDDYDRARRLRQWRQRAYSRLFFAIGCVLLVYSWLTVLPSLWWSPGSPDIARPVAMEATLWMLLAQGMAVRAMWRLFSPRWRDA